MSYKTIFLMFFFLTAFWIGNEPAWAVPGKLYSDMTVSNQNSDAITDNVVWKPGGFDFRAGIGITDNTVYSPGEVFTNTGSIALVNINDSNSGFLSLIGNDNTSITIRNQGNLSLMGVDASDRTYWSYGINTDGNLENSGDITMIYTTQAGITFSIGYGITCNGVTLINSGNVELSLQGGVSSTNVFATARGITFTGTTFINSGDIQVRGQGGDITGSSTAVNAEAAGVYTEGSFLNTGSITATAVAGRYRANSATPYTGGDATAYGIYASDHLILDSRGLIRAQALQASGTSTGNTIAYQVYVNSGTTTITGYAMEFSSPANLISDYNGVIGINTGASVSFSNAVLYPVISNSFSNDVEYAIPMLEDGAAVADQFVSLGPVPPEYQVALVDGNGASLQKLVFTYAPEEDPALTSSEIQHGFDARQHQMIRSNVGHGIVKNLVPARPVDLDPAVTPESLMAGLQAGAYPRDGQGTMAGKNMIFAGPVLLSLNDHSEHGYTADSQGVLSSYTRDLGDGFHLGGHAGVSYVDVQFTGEGSEQRREETLNYSLGSHFFYLLDETWLFSGIATVFYGDTDYRDTAVTNLESASYDAWAGLVDLSVGRFFRMGPYTLLPEVGISNSYTVRDAFTTDNQVNADVRHSRMEEFELYGELSLSCYARYELEEGGALIPHLGLGITRTLTDGVSDGIMGVGTVDRHVSHRTDRTSVNPSVSLTLAKDHLESLVGVSGSFSRDTENYMVWLELGVSF